MTHSPFRRTISANVLNHLVIDLSSDFAAVLSEMVTNAWGADAVPIAIATDSKAWTFEILDDEYGMSVDGINAGFLNVVRTRSHPNLLATGFDAERHIVS